MGRREEGRRTSQEQAGDQAMYEMVTFEALKLFSVKLAARERARSDTAIVPGDDHSSVMTHLDVQRAYFYAQAKPNTNLRGAR